MTARAVRIMSHNTLGNETMNGNISDKKAMEIATQVASDRCSVRLHKGTVGNATAIAVSSSFLRDAQEIAGEICDAITAEKEPVTAAASVAVRQGDNCVLVWFR
jgi:hypothetical protein